jgi:hypothetical protein
LQWVRIGLFHYVQHGQFAMAIKNSLIVQWFFFRLKTCTRLGALLSGLPGFAGRWTLPPLWSQLLAPVWTAREEPPAATSSLHSVCSFSALWKFKIVFKVHRCSASLCRIFADIGAKNPEVLVRIRIRVKFFSLTAFWEYIYVFKDEKSKRSKKTNRNRGFSYFVCLLRTGSGSVQIMTDPDPGGPKTSGSTTLLKFFTLRLQIFDL